MRWGEGHTGVGILSVVITKTQRRRRISHRLIGLVKQRGDGDAVSIGDLAESLGSVSFALCLLLFSLVNLVPLPLGANMIAGLPLVLVGFQMAAGLPTVELPDFIARRHVPRAGLWRTVARLRPLFRMLESVARPRYTGAFTSRNRRLVGSAVFVLAIALCLPIPLSGWGPAIAIFVIGFGLFERDGAIVVLGLGLGVLALAIVAGVVLTILLGMKAAAAVA